jgi:transcriptional regulator with PAS, ATPase and Fis domain
MNIEPVFNNKRGVPSGVIIRLNQSAQINKVQKVITQNKDDSFAFIKGESEVLAETIHKARRLARNTGSVLLIGESGTGKELFAHAIHDEYRPEGSFIAINCSSMPKNLIESELFGYEGGSFTGAERRGRMGKIELANGGTLFLDEIGDMPLEVQPVLLRVLEDKKVMRIGGKNYIPVDFRVVAATNKNLLEMVNAKQFREDLYYRLAVFKLHIPPLRQRNGDVLKLANYFIKTICIQTNNTNVVPRLSKQVEDILNEYEWPGNIRQLQNAITYALAMTNDDIIRPEHLPEEILHGSAKFKNINSRQIPGTGVALNNEARDNQLILNLNMSMMEIEKAAIERALSVTGFNIPDASNILGMARSTLYRKIKEYDIDC